MRLTLIQKFFLLCLMTLVSFGLILGWIMTSSIEKNMINRAKQITASYVSEEVRNNFDSADLQLPKLGDEYESFSRKITKIVTEGRIERVKVWNKDMMVIWADDKRSIGQRFPDNKDLVESLRGEIIAEISSLKKSEHALEREHGRLFELYIPIRSPRTETVESVFEIYQNLDHLYADIAKQRRTVWASILTGFAFLFLMLFGLVWGASRRIESQTREISESAERYRSLVSSAPDGIVLTDHANTVILFNEAAERIFGYTGPDIIGRPLSLLIAEEHRIPYQTIIEDLLSKQRSSLFGTSIEIEGVKKEGRRFPLEMSLSMHGKGGEHIVTWIFRDISERKAMQEQLINSEKHASVSLIAGSIGHELNNTISALLGYSELLLKSPSDSALAQRCAEIFDTQSQRLKMHAHNLLALSKPRKPEMKPVSINSLLDRVTDMLTVSGMLKFYTVVKEYSEELPQVPGDEMLLEQVIRNLEINAAHAMGNQGILTLATGRSDDLSSVELLITDTGHGIPDDKRGQIFLPFFTTKEKGKGTGLGLYIVKQIIEQHRGHITIDSRVGSGTTVTIGLPI